jgi:hypothetical protein
MALTRRGRKKNGSFFAVRPYFYGPRNTRWQELFLSLRERATFVAAILLLEEEATTGDGWGKWKSLPARCHICSCFLIFRWILQLRGCCRDPTWCRGRVYANRDSTLMTCRLVVLLSSSSVARCSSTFVDSDGDGADSYFYSCLSSSSACSYWSFSSLIYFAMRDASSIS